MAGQLWGVGDGDDQPHLQDRQSFLPGVCVSEQALPRSLWTERLPDELQMADPLTGGVGTTPKTTPSKRRFLPPSHGYAVDDG